MKQFELKFEKATVTLRPPRVVILFRGDENWRGWARLALYTSSQVWGGQGFILVPYEGGGLVDDRMIEVVRQYDPDHVLVMSVGAAESASILKSGHVGGEALGADPSLQERDRWIDNDALVARKLIADSSSVFRRTTGTTDVDDDDEYLTFIEPGGRSGGLLAVSAITHMDGGARLAVDEKWGSDAALWAATRSGFPRRKGTDDYPTVRQPPADGDLLVWALDSDGSARAPDELLWFPSLAVSALPTGVKTWFQGIDDTVISLVSNPYEGNGAIVVGDSPVDFATALAYDRLLGFGLWLSNETISSSLKSTAVVSQLDNRIRSMVNAGKAVFLCSTSLTDAELDETSRSLRADPLHLTVNGEPHSSPRIRDLRRGVPNLKVGKLTLAMQHSYGIQVAIPATVDFERTITSIVSTAPYRPMSLVVEEWNLAATYWYVDVDFHNAEAPIGRGVRNSAFQAPDDPVAAILIRSGRGGLSFYAGGSPIKFQGQLLADRTATLTLRSPGMFDWVKAAVDGSRLVARYSDAGTQTQLVATRLGSRSELLDVVSSEYVEALRSFKICEKPITDKIAFPTGDGLVIDRWPYPTLEHLFTRVPAHASTGDLPQFVDRLAESSLIRRGTVVRCSECARRSFIGLDDLGNFFMCPRCAARNPLVSARWGPQQLNPTWFLDLNGAFRNVITGNGEISVLAAIELRRSARRYADVSEVEFAPLDGGSSQGEIDLIAHVDGDIVLVEAKSAGTLGRSKRERTETIVKKLRIAKALRADRLIFATQKSSWPVSELEEARHHATHFGLNTHLSISALTSLKPQ